MERSSVGTSSSIQSLESALDPEEWVDAYGDLFFSYAKSRLRDAGAAEELVQETFLAGIRSLNQYSGRGKQQAWLMGILRRKIVDHIRWRSKRRHHNLGDDDDPTAVLFDENGRWRDGVLPEITPDQEIETGELWEVVRDCLQYLPQGQADVFVLSAMEGMKTEEICKELDISTTNLWVRLHRARLVLAKCVGSKWFE